MKGLPEDQRPLDGTDAASLEKDEVVPDLSVPDEPSHGSDGFLGQVELCGGVGGIASLTYSVDLLVLFGPVVVSHLTSPGNGPLDPGGMPRSDAADLSESSVGLSGELLAAESLDDSAESFSFGGTEHIDGLEILENLIDCDFLLEETIAELDFVLNGSSVDLDLVDIGLLGL